MNSEYKKEFLINVMFVGAIIAITVLVSKFMLSYLFPFIIGVCVALAVQRPAAAISKKTKIRKQAWAVILTILICVIVLAAAVFTVWILGGRLAAWISKMPKYYENLQRIFDSIKASLLSGGSFKIADNSLENSISGALDSLLTSLMNFLSDAAAALIKNLPAFLISSVVTVVASCYIAKDFDRLVKFIAGILPAKKVQKISSVRKIIADNSLKFLKGYGIIAAITFLELSAALAILGVSKPIPKALLVSLVDALPVLGIGTVMLPWATVELLRENFYVGFGLVISYAIIMIVRNFIEPKIIGNQIGINPIFTLIALFLGLKIAGIAGMILFPLLLTVLVEYFKSEQTAGL